MTHPCALTSAGILIERVVAPGQPALALSISDIDTVHCASNVDTLAMNSTTAAGYCTQLARSADNPGYDVKAFPAPPLRNVVAQVGAAC